jgi:hypothetical protein
VEDRTSQNEGARGGSLTEIAPGVAYTTAVFANLYFVDAGGDEPGGVGGEGRTQKGRSIKGSCLRIYADVR